MAKDWYVDKGLGVLIAQLKWKYPGIEIGTIAGGGHVATWPATDHAPEPDGSVDAADLMIGPDFTTDDAYQVVDALVKHRDERIAYIIWQKRIISSTVQPWVWRPYKGADPHTGHPHISVNDKHENDTSSWDLSTEDDNEMFPEKGDTGNGVKYWQNVLTMLDYNVGKIDGVYGPMMEAAVNEYRAKFGQGPNSGISAWHAAHMTRALAAA